MSPEWKSCLIKKRFTHHKKNNISSLTRSPAIVIGKYSKYGHKHRIVFVTYNGIFLPRIFTLWLKHLLLTCLVSSLLLKELECLSGIIEQTVRWISIQKHTPTRTHTFTRQTQLTSLLAMFTRKKISLLTFTMSAVFKDTITVNLSSHWAVIPVGGGCGSKGMMTVMMTNSSHMWDVQSMKRSVESPGFPREYLFI